jgi:DNA replication protein DnaC
MTTTSLEMHLRALRLPSFQAHHDELAHTAEDQGWSFVKYLHSLAELEIEHRRIRRIQRLRHASSLPADKTMATLEIDRFPIKIRRQVPVLCDGDFVERAQNVLAFGLPGRGKTHLVCAIGHELVERGYKVLFCPAYQLVQRLLVAKRDLLLDKELARLDRFHAIIIDDIGYIQQSREEMEVLFTLLSERYERRSVMITSNLVFSKWDKIFKDAMTTAAAIDRLVHHCIILELAGDSYRNEQAKKRNGTRRERKKK